MVLRYRRYDHIFNFFESLSKNYEDVKRLLSPSVSPFFTVLHFQTSLSRRHYYLSTSWSQSFFFSFYLYLMHFLFLWEAHNSTIAELVQKRLVLNTIMLCLREIYAVWWCLLGWKKVKLLFKLPAREFVDYLLAVDLFRIKVIPLFMFALYLG